MNKKLLIGILVITIIVMGIFSYSLFKKPDSVSKEKCGNRICEPGENRATCNKDCWQLSPQEQEVLKDADKRIEQYRKGNANLIFTYRTGVPVSNATVKIEQKEHEFLFGSNHDHGIWDEILKHKFGIETPFFSGKPAKLTKEQLDNYLAKFNAFANYVHLPTAWNKYEPENDNFLDQYFTQINDWLGQDGNKTRGGSFIWNAYTPGWVPDDCQSLNKELEEYVRHITSNFKDSNDYLGVVNELANAAVRKNEPMASDKMTKCIREMGIVEWGKKWFKIAREEAPNAKLLINEVAWNSPDFIKLLNELKDDNGKKLYDSIGIQSHMFVQIYPLDWLFRICEESLKFGVPVQFTETTVLSGTPMTSTTLEAADFGKESTPKGEAKQAEYYVWYYKTLFSHPAVESINIWNLTDYRSWRDGPAGLLRKDMSPKPSYNALMDLIYNQWWTINQTKTSNIGEAQFRGFYGDYNVTVITDAGKEQTFNIKLSKDRDNKFKLVLR